jgi:hypothetical protein
MSTVTRRTVHAYLVDRAENGPAYLRARDIAHDLGGSPKAVGQYLSQLQNELSEISLEKWGRSKSTTWRIEAVES